MQDHTTGFKVYAFCLYCLLGETGMHLETNVVAAGAVGLGAFEQINLS